MENPTHFNTALIIQLTAATLSGLVAGLLYGYQCSVNGGLAQLPDRQYLQAFQSINEVIQNPYFFLSFMGSLLALAAATWQSHTQNPGAFSWLLAAFLIYGVGVFGITIVGNVPLNEQLANFPVVTATASEAASMRKAFEQPWNTYHHIRTFAAIIAFVLTLVSLLKQSKL
ncbi:DUF1772 domain-containing protein [Flavobacterium sp. 3HN19-14]|uniref:anthrone oxygenase family protein n=1 Tax=Flavobacterium sp. 3HN19-14 TaxID=3448133 RepID=UPI003EE042DD